MKRSDWGAYESRKVWKVMLRKHHGAPRRSETRSHESLDWHGGMRILTLAWCGQWVALTEDRRWLEKPVFSESQEKE